MSFTKNFKKISFSEHLKIIGLISILVLVIDIVWLSLFLGKYFGNMVFNIQNEKMVVNYYIASLAYIFIILSIYYFIILKDNGKMYVDAFLLGLFIYGIFEFTSGAIFKKWNKLPLIVDTLWGGILYLLTYTLFKLIYQKEITQE
jgi:uncharacterized membrane protein